MWTDRDWKVENGFDPSDGSLALTVDLILSMADSENLKIFSLRTGAGGACLWSPLDFAESGSADGSERSSLTRVFRALVRSRNGVGDTEDASQQIAAHELMKCHVDVPSRTAWLKAHPIANPSLSFVNCNW